MIQRIKKRILIIDDSPEDRNTYRRFLADNNTYQFIFDEVETGEEGVDIIQERRPDCILLDYSLPGTDGLEILEIINEDKSGMSHNVIMMTGRGNEALAVKAMKSGATDYLVKGTFDALEMSRSVINAIQKIELMVQVEDQRNELAQFAYVAAHDLRQPLKTIAGHIQLLDRRLNDNNIEKSLGHLNYISNGVLRMQELVDSLLSYTRLGQENAPMTSVDFNKLIEEVLQDLQSLIEEKNAKINVKALPSIYADSYQMRQLFANLIANALKYHGATPPIVDIEATLDKEHWVFKICDQGEGIEEEFYQQIFEPFKRLHRRSEVGGAGIGLATCKKIIERHGGKIWVDSKRNEGSIFYFTLPDLTS